MMTMRAMKPFNTMPQSTHLHDEEEEEEEGELEKENPLIRAQLRKLVVVETMRRPRMLDYCARMSKYVEEMKKRFHLFKIILPSNIQERCLGLPKKFIRKFGKELSEAAIFTVPSGTTWIVELRETEGEIWFQDGWQEFMDYHSVGNGYFLVFGYDGNSHFHVLIFDMTVCEIKYPCHAKDFGEPNLENVCQAPSTEERDPVEILDVSSTHLAGAETINDLSDESEGHQTTKAMHLTPLSRLRYSLRSIARMTSGQTFGKAKFSSSQATQRTEHDGNDSSLQEESSADVPITRTSCSTTSGTKRNFNGPAPYKKKMKLDAVIEKFPKLPNFLQRSQLHNQKRKADISNKLTCASVKPKKLHVMEIERKAILDSYNSEFSCFTAVLPRCRTNYMTIPKKVEEENGLMNKESLQLSDPHGRLWPVTVTHRMDGRVNLGELSEFRKGNNLEAGDTCRFKFNEGLGNVVYMGIFRAKELVEPISQCLKPSLMLTCTPNEDATQATGSREGSDSVEIVDVSPIRPKADLMKEVIEGSEGQQTSKMRRLTPRSRLRYSLRSFERNITRPTFDSHLRCTTQVKSLPKRDRNSTKYAEAFSFCQVTQSTESDGYDSALREELSDHEPISRNSYSTMYLRRWHATTLMTRVAREFTSDNPFYLVTMRSSYVNKPFKLNVPSDFARKYIKHNLSLTLRVSDGRSWRVQCHSVEYGAKIAGGWRYFVKENRLKEGDVCVFELVNRHSIEEMKVVIYRACT